MFSVMWYELLMPSAISCPMWSSVYECHNVECAFTSPVSTECGMFVMCCMQFHFNIIIIVSSNLCLPYLHAFLCYIVETVEVI